jgi:hypothetical protein
MTDDLRDIAVTALAGIAAKTRKTVFAFRRGICAGWEIHGSRKKGGGDGQVVMFRRVGDAIRMELWPSSNANSNTIKEYPLPDDLQKAARKMLDKL